MDIHSLSNGLKRMRQKRGLSLSQLASRVNTSPATLSRYENGWERFELYTLNKIATALGLKLDINFMPAKLPSPAKNISNAIGQLGRLFWDRKLQKGDIKKYPAWVVGRVAEFGSLEDIHFLIQYLGKKAFLKHIANIKPYSTKTANFWKIILEKEENHARKGTAKRRA